MEPLIRPEQLKQLAQQLQAHLKPQSQVTPLQVQCVLKDKLMVLVQHPPGAMPDSQQVFSALEQAIPNLSQDLLASLVPAIAANGAEVRFFLRILGQSQPYARHDFTPALIPDSWVNTDPAAIAPTATVSTAATPTAATPTAAAPTATAPTATVSTAMDTSPITQTPNNQDSFHSSPTKFSAKSASAKSASAKLSPDASSPDESSLAKLPLTKSQSSLVQKKRPADALNHSPQKRDPFNPKPWLVAGGGIAAAALIGGAGYVLTRPCVIGGCSSLQTAQSLSQESAQLLKGGASDQNSQQAQQKLTAARQLVGDIPPWSGHYGEAQEMQQTLDRVLAAESKAKDASQKGQTPTQPVTEWRAVESLWREAIAQLEPIPQNNPLHSLAQEHLALYRANLTFASQRVATEQDGQQRLITAKKTSSLAETRQNTAQTPQEWQMAQVTWQMAVNALKQIPSGTTSHAEAQQLVESYGTKLMTVRDRSQKEQIAQKSYTQALNLEKQAKDFQRQNQWAQASATWQAALTQAKQISQDTSLSTQAQTLVTTYTAAANQAQTIIKLRADLDQVCFTSGRICDYTINDEGIKINFTATYERKIRTVGGMSWFSGDFETMYKIDKHIASLGKALQAISTNSGMSIEVYNSDKRMVGAFSPGGG